MNIGFPLQRIKNIGSTFSTFEKSLPSVLEYIIRYIPIFSHDSIQIMDCCFQYSDINEGGSFYGNDAITSDFYHFYVNLDPDLLPIFCEYVKSSNNTDGLLSYLIKMKPSMKNITPINDNRLFLKKSNWAEFKTVLDPVSNNIATRIISKVYARVGLMGNPSDGFYGKTISLLINNFWAETTLVESTDESIQFILNPLLDPIKFDSIRNINSIMKKDGYSGASTLFLALIKVFVDYCNSNNIEIKSRGFKILYNTNIPRQGIVILTQSWSRR